MHFFYYTLIAWNLVSVNYLSMDTRVCPYVQYLHLLKNTVEDVLDDKIPRKFLEVEKVASSPEGCVDFLKDGNRQLFFKYH